MEKNFSNNLVNDAAEKVKVELYFKGNTYNGSTNYLPKREDIISQPVSEVHEKINIIDLKDTEFYNRSGSIFIIHINAHSYNPGNYLKELLTSDDQISGKFNMLQTFR